MKTFRVFPVLIVLVCLLVGISGADVLQPGFGQYDIAQVTGRTRLFGLDLADFNGDLIDDIVCGDTNGDVHLFTGNGDGTFTDQGIVINQAYHNAYGLEAADFNGDGNADFVLTLRDNYPTTSPTMFSGEVHLYLGNGNGTFQASGFPQAGLLVGDVGTASCAVTAGDVDGDMDIDIIASDVTVSDNLRADVILFRNQGNNGSNQPIWSAGETLISGEDLGYTPNAEQPPYYPPESASNIDAYGLELADMDGDGDKDLMVTDLASYVYVYLNDGGGTFAPVRYNNISTGARPYAYARAHETFTQQLAITCGDLNGDGMNDFVVGGSAGTWDGTVDLWLNTGNISGEPQFLYAGQIGAQGTDARGLAIGQLNSNTDAYADVVFGNFEGYLTGLITDRADSDLDGIIDLYDNAPLHWNAPRLDMNDDGGVNYLDQLDNDQDNIGDPADDDDDNDGVLDGVDNSPFVSNADQLDTDNDGRGDVSDPLNNTDSDGDGIFDGPIDPNLYEKAKLAKARWSQSDTHFILRIDALGRVFQNEFTQTMTDGAILTPQEWELNRNFSYNGVGDDPATAGYQVPSDLPGGKDTPISLVMIPRRMWYAYGDDDPIRWMNARLSNPNLEIGQHGTYHSNNTLDGDWADDPALNYFSCETCGFTLEEMYQYLRIGKRTLLGDYADWWIQDQGADPLTSPKVDWTNAANPLISYAPPFNASDTVSRDATSRLFIAGFSASVYEENSNKFTPEGSHHEQFDDFGMYHASADRQVDPENNGYATYLEYLQSITQVGQLNTWLIEEVEWSSRYCNDIDRLEPCASAPGGINRENNMVDLARWEKWMTLLDYVNSAGQPMLLGEYSLAMSFDNAPTVSNPNQEDTDHDGIGDVVDGAVLTAADVTFSANGGGFEGTLSATLSNNSVGIAGQTVEFSFDSDGNGTPETYSAVTNASGVATAAVTSSLVVAGNYAYTAFWDGIVTSAADQANVTIPCELAADLTGDCRVLIDDYAVAAAQWLATGDPQNCTLTADIAGGDCTVTAADLAVLMNEWLK